VELPPAANPERDWRKKTDRITGSGLEQKGKTGILQPRKENRSSAHRLKTQFQIYRITNPKRKHLYLLEQRKPMKRLLHAGNKQKSNNND
jgi:hypothetical protein